jgi:2-polyprenyl-3-methyl-5-hydroxy-6-metoxy-1,4-benzoquinol methylase
MHEWAKAHKNLTVAQEHIKRAKLKMEFRKERFKGKEKEYEFAEILCEEMMKKLEKIKADLRSLINKYGIKQQGKYSKTLLKYLQPPKMISAEEWVKKN